MQHEGHYEINKKSFHSVWGGQPVRVSLRDNGGEKEEISIEVESPILKAFQRVWFYVH